MNILGMSVKKRISLMDKPELNPAEPNQYFPVVFQLGALRQSTLSHWVKSRDYIYY